VAVVSHRIAYLTDVEGRWDKLASFADGNHDVSLAGDRLVLAEHVTFVFGGDAVDRGPSGRRVVSTLLDAHRRYGDRVVLLAGNRDINKMRLARELRGAPPAGAPTRGTRGELLRWIFAHTMGAKDAFAHRAAELALGAATDDEAIVQSFEDDVGPGGDLRAYLLACRLGFRSGHTLFLHGGVTAENFGVVPGHDTRLPDVDAWARALDAFYANELEAFVAGREPSALLRYQAPREGTRFHQESVVYARLADELGNPLLPSVEAIARLRESGVHRLVVGHTPSGDCPAIVRDGDFELVLADNSYGRIERGSQVTFDGDETRVVAVTELDDGQRVPVRFTSTRGERSALGLRDAPTQRLMKARLEGGDYLSFHGLPGYRVEQLRQSERALTGRDLVPAR
jgi:hypothetical protein